MTHEGGCLCGAVRYRVLGEPARASVCSCTACQRRTGRLSALGVPSAKRSAALPDVPTFEESGLAGFDVTSWVGIFAPAKTPAAVVDRLYKELAFVLRTPFVKERYGVLGIEPIGSSPRQFFEQVREDLARWEKVVKAANIKVE